MVSLLAPRLRSLMGCATAFVLGLMLHLLPGVARAQVSIVDHAGRTVTLPHPARKVVLTDGIDLLALGLIEKQPSRLLAGWNPRWLDGPTLDLIRAGDPAMAAVPQVGATDPATFPVERVVALEPDLVVLSPYYASRPDLARKLEAAGVAVAVLSPSPAVDRRPEEQDLVRLGRLVGREQEALAFMEFFERHAAVIRERLGTGKKSQSPDVLLEAHAGGGACCMSPGRAESIGRFVDFAGGRNIGADIIPGMAGQLSLEYILAADPAVYIGTGGGHMASRGGLVLGPGRAAEEARRTLDVALRRKGIAQISAVRTGRTYGLWHDLARSALNIVAIEAIARWTHPELFPDLKPLETLDAINRDFLAFPMSGTFLVEPAGTGTR